MPKSQQLLENLKKALSNAVQNLSSFANNLEALLEVGKLAELDLPGKTDGDRLKNLIYLPVEKGGLGTDVNFVDYLLKNYPNIHAKFREVYNTRDKKDTSVPGVEVNLDPKDPLFEPSPEAVARAAEEKKEMDAAAKAAKAAKPSKSKSKKSNKKTDSPITDQQVSRDNATQRAKKAVPVLEDLIGNGLVNKSDVTKLGKKSKSDEETTVKEQQRVQEELSQLVEQYGGDISQLSDEEKKDFKIEAKLIIEPNLPKVKSIKLEAVDKVAKQLLERYSTSEIDQLIDLLKSNKVTQLPLTKKDNVA